MKKLKEFSLSQDFLKLTFLLCAMLGAATLFIISPSLSTPALIAFVLTSLLKPAVTYFERKGLTQSQSIMLVFGLIGLLIAIIGFWGIQAIMAQWADLKENAPTGYSRAIEKMRALESHLKENYRFLKNIHLTDLALKWGDETSAWFIEHGPLMVTKFVRWTFIVPVMTFAFLSEGGNLKRRFFQLVPNRFFESFFMVTYKIFSAISDYFQAKLIEAFLVGLIVGVGLAILRTPYAIILGLVAGISNIVPYIGPIAGAAPAIVLIAFDPESSSNLIAIASVYAIANIADSVLIFPNLVGKLINLHPLILVAVVGVGQTYYGMIGMLISTPLAAALKVIIQEIYSFVYDVDPNL